MMELVDMTDLKSVGPKGACGFESHSRYTIYNYNNLIEVRLDYLGLSYSG